MSHWLIAYHWRDARLLICDEYEDGQLAIQHRFEWERYYAPAGGVEVVVLGADSLDTIKRTHSRYFAGELSHHPKQHDPEGER